MDPVGLAQLAVFQGEPAIIKAQKIALILRRIPKSKARAVRAVRGTRLFPTA